MSHTVTVRGVVLALGVVAAALVGVPTMAGAQTVSGFASGAQGTVLGMPAALGHTGSLVNEDDARAVSQEAGSIGSALNAQVIETSTISSVRGAFDPSDSVASAASLANLAITAAGSGIRADYVGAAARAPVGGTSAGSSTVEGLSVNGVPVYVSGEPNQTVYLPGLTLVINEVRSSASCVTVSALRVTTADGLTDLAVATASAGTR